MTHIIPQSTENGNGLQSRVPLKVAIIGGGLVSYELKLIFFFCVNCLYK